MPRTIRLKIYKFHELTPAAKKRAIRDEMQKFRNEHSTLNLYDTDKRAEYRILENDPNFFEDGRLA